MKDTHTHHTKKKSKKNHSSKAKLRNIAQGKEKIKIHTRTKTAKKNKKKDTLQAVTLKVPNKNYHTKEDVISFIKSNTFHAPRKEIKLILEK